MKLLSSSIQRSNVQKLALINYKKAIPLSSLCSSLTYFSVIVEDTDMLNTLLTNLSSSNMTGINLVLNSTCQLTENFCQKISESKITDLSLNGDDTEKWCAMIGSNLQTMKLQKLKLANEIYDCNIEILMAGVSLSGLQELDLNGNYCMSSFHLETIAKYLPKTNLTKLSIDSGSYNYDDLVALASALDQAKLTELTIQFGRASIQEAIVPFLEHVGKLKKLVLLGLQYDSDRNFCTNYLRRYPHLDYTVKKECLRDSTFDFE